MSVYRWTVFDASVGETCPSPFSFLSSSLYYMFVSFFWIISWCLPVQTAQDIYVSGGKKDVYVIQNFISENSMVLFHWTLLTRVVREDNIARRRQPYVNSNNKYLLWFNSHSLWQFFLKVGQPTRSRSLGQKSWYRIKGLATRNVHVKYESPISSGYESMAKVKVFWK